MIKVNSTEEDRKDPCNHPVRRSFCTRAGRSLPEDKRMDRCSRIHTQASWTARIPGQVPLCPVRTALQSFWYQRKGLRTALRISCSHAFSSQTDNNIPETDIKPICFSVNTGLDQPFCQHCFTYLDSSKSFSMISSLSGSLLPSGIYTRPTAYLVTAASMI